MNQASVGAFVLALLFATAQGRAEDYTIKLESSGEQIAVISLTITGDTAIAEVAGVTEQFDLKNQRWQHDDSEHWVTLDQSKVWAKQSKEKSIKTMASAPEPVRAFLQWSLDPKFEIKFADDTLTLTSGQVDYKIAVEKSDRDLSGYFLYAKLNAYKKAMTQRKLPPFAELLVVEELERRSLLPKVMEIETPGIPGAPSLKILMSQAE